MSKLNFVQFVCSCYAKESIFSFSPSSSRCLSSCPIIYVIIIIMYSYYNFLKIFFALLKITPDSYVQCSHSYITEINCIICDNYNMQQNSLGRTLIKCIFPSSNTIFFLSLDFFHPCFLQIFHFRLTLLAALFHPHIFFSHAHEQKD